MPILPPGLQGYVAAQQQARASDEQNLRGALGILNAQNMMRQQAFEEQLHPLKLKMMEEQVRSSQNPAPVLKDLGGSFGVFDPRTYQQIGTLPKSATPDAVLTDQRARWTHENPSASSVLGANVTIRGQDITDLRAREEGAANRGVTLRGQNLVDARSRDANATSKAPPGYRFLPDGSLEAIPGGPVDHKNAEKMSQIKLTLDTYLSAREGILSGLAGTVTGPLAGRVPAMTTGQQIAEGGVSAMAPVLKQMFRVAGEGVFTDRDQALLLDMVPKRTDTPEARQAKMDNIDRIVSSKLGMPLKRSGETGAWDGVERRSGLSNAPGVIDFNSWGNR